MYERRHRQRTSTYYVESSEPTRYPADPPKPPQAAPVQSCTRHVERVLPCVLSPRSVSVAAESQPYNPVFSGMSFFQCLPDSTNGRWRMAINSILWRVDRRWLVGAHLPRGGTHG